MLEHWNGLNFPYKAIYDEDDKKIYVYLQSFDEDTSESYDELLMTVHGYQALNSITMI